MERPARGALAEMRTLLIEMRPDTLATVVQLMEQHSAPTEGGSASWSTEFCGLPAIPREVSVTLFRIAQEALQNVTGIPARARRGLCST